MLGILTLDTAFPRINGDVGAPGTFAFPVLHRVVAGAGVEGVVHAPDRALLPAFIAAARELEAEGCIALATTCGFLVRWQPELAAAVEVPVMTSALLQVPVLARCLPQRRRIGVVTYSADAITPDLLAAAGADPATPVAGVDPAGYFARTIRQGATTLDRDRMAADVIAAARDARRTPPAGRTRARMRQHAALSRRGDGGGRAARLRCGRRASAGSTPAVTGDARHARRDLW